MTARRRKVPATRRIADPLLIGVGGAAASTGLVYAGLSGLERIGTYLFGEGGIEHFQDVLASNGLLEATAKTIGYGIPLALGGLATYKAAQQSHRKRVTHSLGERVRAWGGMGLIATAVAAGGVPDGNTRLEQLVSGKYVVNEVLRIDTEPSPTRVPPPVLEIPARPTEPPREPPAEETALPRTAPTPTKEPYAAIESRLEMKHLFGRGYWREEDPKHLRNAKNVRGDPAMRGRARGAPHTGFDWPGDVGTPLYPIGDGVLHHIAPRALAGKRFTSGPWARKRILPANGNMLVYETTIDGIPVCVTYSHMEDRDFAKGLRKGSRITTDTFLGRIGYTGNANRNDPHVHVEVRVPGCKGARKDPTPYLRR